MDRKLRDSLFWLLFLANLGGALYGFIFYYGPVLLSAPPSLLIFIPDCPLFALLFALSMLAVRYAPGRFNLFNFLTFAGCLKYGFWTVFVLTFFKSFYAPTPEDVPLAAMLVVSHIFLFFEAFLLASYVRPKLWHVLAVLSFMLLSDSVDYLLGAHPPIPSGSLPLMFQLTVAMSLVAVLGGYLILRRAERPLLPLLEQA